MKKMPLRWIIVIAVAGLLVVAFLARGRRPLDVSVATAARDTLSVTISVEGRTRAIESYTVTAPVSGRLARLDVDQGDIVEKGQLLGHVFPAPEDARTLETLRAEVAAATASLVEAEARRSEAAVTADQAWREVERRRPLLDIGAITPEAMEHVELTAAVAGERLAGAEAIVATARARLAGTEARLLGAAGSDAGAPRVLIRAPVSGQILEIADQSERVLGMGTTLLVIANTGGLEVVFDVLSEEAVRIASGQRVLVDDWGSDDILSGTVRRVTMAGYTKISALGVEEQRVDVVADLDHVPSALGAGYRVAGAVLVWEGSQVLSVPASAIFRAGAGWRVFVVEDGRATLREIQIGHRNEQAAEIVDGVAEGEAVILFPSEFVEDGVRVRVQGS